ncbi:uncharacterized protein [Euphorbia lathyris]|uniref:uncharacterized protein isoform X2 n=1 Tax=Euphorbia lathyris TaxID=212925 RepID=UPI003313A391
MDSEGSSVSFSNSSSSSGSLESGSMAADRMVRIEMEAAEALADLADFALRENGNCDSSSKWGSKGKRGKKRVYSESSLDYSVLNPVVDSVPSCLDLAPDQMTPDKQSGEPFFRHVVINPAKIETNVADIAETSLSSVKSHPSFGGGRSRQNLTEDEKEERRLRRILANRESARQTIRRRQALCEELTRKAADLAWENESLKREKELALEEYESLESKNKDLKEQTAKLIKTEPEDSSGDLKSAPAEKSAAPATNCPLLLYNQHPFSPLCWPSIIQSSNALQSNHGPQNAIVVPNISAAQQQKENPIVVSGAQTPIYIVSCPWFFPVTDHGNGLHLQPSFGLKHMLEGMSINNHYGSNSSSKATALMENQLSSLPEEVKAEATTSAKVRVINDLNEIPLGFPPDGGGQCAGYHSKGTTLSLVKPTAAIKDEIEIDTEFIPYPHGFCSKPRQLMNALPGSRDSHNFPSKKLVDAAAATEARKRRKELTKLKNLNG